MQCVFDKKIITLILVLKFIKLNLILCLILWNELQMKHMRPMNIQLIKQLKLKI